jgi:hypothetical protein
MFGGRTENILDGGNAYFGGDRLNNSGVSAQNNPKGLAAQIAVLDPFQFNAIIRAEEENARRKIVQAPVITAANAIQPLFLTILASPPAVGCCIS